jgi:hypothetical protein
MLALGVFSAGLLGLVSVWWRRPEQRRAILVVAAVGGLGFQALHFVEHGVQMAAWVLEPGSQPFLTPWAVAGRDALTVGGDVPLGEELLHLVGNVVFLAGLAALWALAAGQRERRSRSLNAAIVAQGLHVVEHVALTASAALVGRSIGVTTFLGTLDPGPVLWTIRPTAHLLLNTVASILAVMAVRHWLASAAPTLGHRAGVVHR